MTTRCRWMMGAVMGWVAAGALFARPVAAQTATIRGTVTDSTHGAPIAGASVSIPGTALKAQTGAAGDYVITGVTPGAVTVRAQMIGYAPMERALTLTTPETTVDFVLAARVRQLEDLVGIGYGEQSREELSTAISSIDGDALRAGPVASLDLGLQSKVPGVQVNPNAGNPGNAVSLRIRGAASLSASNEPLYVIDGVPMVTADLSQFGMGGQGTSGVTGISMDDVDHIDVLKDAAATAIYGSRGSNGVVLITTKRGQAGRTSVTFNSYIGTQAAARRLDMLNATEYLTYFNEAAANDGYGDDYFGVVGVDDAINTDWQDAVLRRRPIGNSELAISGGNERTQYRVSGSFFDQDGIVVGSGYRRIAGRANLDINPTSRLTLSTSLAIAAENNRRVKNDASPNGIITNAVGNAPNTPVRDDAGAFTGPPDLLYPNPVALGEINSTRSRTMRVLGNVESRFRITPAVSLTSRIGFDIADMREDQFESRLVIGTYAAGSNGVAKSGYKTAHRYVVDNFLTFTPKIGTRGSLNATGGVSVEANRGELNFVRGEGFPNDRFTQVHNATTIVETDGTNSKSNLLSFFSRASYTLDGKYIFGASLRADGSSRFGPNNRWGIFPSVSAAWIGRDDRARAQPRFVNYFKARASYGLTGNQAINDYPFQGLTGTFNYGDLPGTGPSTLANPDLRWESTEQFDLGLDVELLRGRVALTADYYRKKTRDLLVERAVPLVTGFSSVFDNIGNVQNNGFELGITTINVEAKREGGFEWTTTLALSLNRNKVTDLFRGQPLTGGIRDINRVQVGQPIGAFYTLKFLGVDPATGDAIYDDVDGDGDITSADLQVVGSPHPDYSGGLGSTVSYRGFDVSAFLAFSHGADVFNMMRLFSGNGGYYTDNQFRDVLKRWRQPGDVTNEPRASYDGNSGAERISSRFMEDGSFWRMQDLTVGYKVPVPAASRFGFQSARLYVSAHNLFTITDYSGYWPEVNSNGVTNIDLGTDYYSYPVARTFTFGVQLGW